MLKFYISSWRFTSKAAPQVLLANYFAFGSGQRHTQMQRYQKSSTGDLPFHDTLWSTSKGCAAHDKPLFVFHGLYHEFWKYQCLCGTPLSRKQWTTKPKKSGKELPRVCKIILRELLVNKIFILLCQDYLEQQKPQWLLWNRFLQLSVPQNSTYQYTV